MKAQTNHSIIDNALQRKLRNAMTDAEIRLWRRLRGRQMAGCKFRRQHPFMDYVLDFVCLENRWIVEVDGGQHLECRQDQVRDRCLQEAGFRVLRFWNNQVLQELDMVVETIWQALQELPHRLPHRLPHPLPHPHPSPPLEGEGENLAVQELPHPLPNPPLEGEGENLLPLQGGGREGDGVKQDRIKQDRAKPSS